MMNRWMQKCLDLASLAQGDTAPNPMVGSVLVCEDTILCEGYHKGPGQWHAEREALLQISSEKVPQNAVLYVNLEPCCSHGRTPPCTDIIISKGITKVVVGMLDPDPRMAGKGIEVLEKAGIEVVVGVNEKECKEHNRAYLMARQYQRPWIRLKAGISLDGKIATHFGESQWITSSSSRQNAHQIRNIVDGILVGKNTLTLDNPSLTTRLSEEHLLQTPQQRIHQPRPIVLSTSGIDPNLNLKPKQKQKQKLKLFQHPKRPIVFSKNIFESEHFDSVSLPKNEKGEFEISDVLQKLVEMGIYDLLVEGGGKIHRSFLQSGCFDELYLYVAPKILGAGQDWIAHLPRHLKEVETLQLIETIQLEEDILLHYRNPNTTKL
jgi:diaminohydroxyphosphoribosylaminopyrimidine deaminase / 5-amino-6-(5-phosphoribosylamino)uracil reductase